MKFLLLAFCLNLSMSFANDQSYIELVKKEVQTDLKENYLPKLINEFGHCEESKSSCLTQQDDIVTLETKEKKICFPYTECGFYKCMEDKYKCSEVNVNYFTKLAYPTCKTYEKNVKAKKFTKKGIRWIYTVMACLQVGLVDECDRDKMCSPDPRERKKVCDHITEFTLSYHPGCYINSAEGVCHLPFKDKVNIWKTVKPFLTPRERQEAYKVVFHCIFKGKKLR